MPCVTTDYYYGISTKSFKVPILKLMNILGFNTEGSIDQMAGLSPGASITIHQEEPWSSMWCCVRC